MRWAPGYSTPEEILDPHRTEEGRARLRAQRESTGNAVKHALQMLQQTAQLHFGQSQHFGKPVLSLLQERSGVTLASVTLGLSLAWLSALTATYFPPRLFPAKLAQSLAVLLQSVPAAVLALLGLAWGWSAWWAVGLALAAVLFPPILFQTRKLTDRREGTPPVLLARAQGFGRASLWRRRILRQAAQEICALAGVSLSWAFSALVPLEAIADQAGLGQLAWQAALARDLPLLTALLLFLCAGTVLAAGLRSSQSLGRP
ncbi:ABC transporter permease subunit [Bryobacter aggregatus]|uniref:ABC transporter permease subunit n=1 Tax=Bryobacter aggregatus TaxID=360054 RepID=UPI001EE39D7F|nr:ABC transporter permease subunit [Bryobacter aggregatus]